jgi:hypothetical protein
LIPMHNPANPDPMTTTSAIAGQVTGESRAGGRVWADLQACRSA